jgi:hypothetical protein
MKLWRRKWTANERVLEWTVMEHAKIAALFLQHAGAAVTKLERCFEQI